MQLQVLNLALLVWGFWCAVRFGAFNALLSLLIVLLASCLAAGTHEALAVYLIPTFPEVARGTVFLLVFMSAMSLLKFLSKRLIPSGFSLPRYWDMAAAALPAWLFSLTVTGTLMVGGQMLPLPTRLLEFDRYIAGLESPPVFSLWVGTDEWVSRFWQITLPGWSRLHPDLLKELYALRLTVSPGSRRTLAPTALEVLHLTDQVNISLPPAEGCKYWAVRSFIDKQPQQTTWARTEDEDGFYRVTPAQIRLITREGVSVWPCGYFCDGRKYTVLRTDTPVVEDFPAAGGRLAQDWVFQLPEAEIPWLFEEKGLARATLPEPLDKPLALMSLSSYAPRAFLKTRSGFQISMPPDLTASKVSGQWSLWILKPSIQRRSIDIDLLRAFNQLRGVEHPLAARAEAMKSVPPSEGLPWGDVLKVLLAGEEQASDPQRSRDFVEKTVRSLCERDRESFVLGLPSVTLATTHEGTLQKGRYYLVAVASTSDSLQLWGSNIEILPETVMTRVLMSQMRLVKVARK